MTEAGRFCVEDTEVILNPNDRVWMPCLGSGVGSIEKEEDTQASTVSGTVTSAKHFHER